MSKLRLSRIVSLLTLSVVLLAGCGKSETPAPAPRAEEPKAAAPAAPPADASLQRAMALFGVLPERMEADGREITDAKVALGRVLYSDPRFSKNHDVACATCHALDHFGVDPRAEAMEKGTSPGHGNQFGGRNSPTSFNAGLQIAQFWDGRAADLEEQAKGPVLNPVEMAMPDETTVVSVIKTIPGYAPMFAEAFPGEEDPITYENMAAAIGAFERLLVTPGPLDAFLSGDTDALSAAARQGMAQFLDSGCASCHMGPALGGTMYQKLGLMQAYETADTGRFEATGNEGDRYFFKVPTLRNIAETGPYFHDGSIKTHDEAISIMAKHQTPGGELSDTEAASIEAFLEALTGAPPAELVAAPALPESGPDTPAPDPS